MFKGKKIYKYCILGMFVFLPVVFTKPSPASFSKQSFSYTVEIDGVNFGSFSDMSEVENTDVVTFERDFITEPSLYEWAKLSTQEKSNLYDIKINKLDKNGSQVSSFVLDQAKPLSWTVETGSRVQNGLHEKVKIAIQGVSSL